MHSLFEFFAEHAATQSPLVLATVVGTEGSTYSKTGECLLLTGDGRYQGLLSGGCLEGDLALRAGEVLSTNRSQQHRYDMRGDDDLLFGMGVGCEGAIDILLQPLQPRENYAPFTAIVAAIAAEHRCVLVTSLHAHARGNSVLVIDDETCVEFGLKATQPLVETASRVGADGHSQRRSILDSNGEGDYLLTVVRPAPHLLALGGGPDVLPLVRMAAELGWRTTVADHRPAYLDRLPGDIRTIAVRPDLLAENLNLADYDRAVVMSHHLLTDCHYLRQLADCEIAYIGLLGPPARRDRVLLELGDTADVLQSRLYGPAGLNLGGRGASAIALSILAQMQQILHEL